MKIHLQVPEKLNLLCTKYRHQVGAEYSYKNCRYSVWGTLLTSAMPSVNSCLWIMTVVCYRWDGWPVAVAIADVSVLQETFNADSSLWNCRPDLSISECLFVNRIFLSSNVDFQGVISVL